MKLLVFSLVLMRALVFAGPAAKLISRSVMAPVVNKGRITNGNNAFMGQFPYQVGLLLKFNYFSWMWCGGSLIGSQWILTAAHCTDGVQSVTVYLGSTVRTISEVIYTVPKDDIIIHSGWNSSNFNDDISLIRIPSVPLSSAIQIVKLPSIASSYSTYTDDYVIASGWGRISDATTTTIDELQWARLQVISNSRCQITFGSILTPSHLCVATTRGVSTCNGDSGGPLVLESSGVQIGLTSFGSSDGCTKGYPAAFTRLTNFLDWIQSNSGIAY